MSWRARTAVLPLTVLSDMPRLAYSILRCCLPWGKTVAQGRHADVQPGPFAQQRCCAWWAGNLRLAHLGVAMLRGALSTNDILAWSAGETQAL